MHSRWYNLAVVLLWLSTMSWLIGRKLMPALWVGDPPDSATILAATQAEPLVGWTLLLDDRPVGWALNLVNMVPQGLTELHSRVHFSELPFSRSVPSWFRQLLGPAIQVPGTLQVEFDSTLVFDAFGHLSRFNSAARFLPSAPNDAVVRLQGTIDGARLALTIRAGAVTDDVSLTISGKTLLSDAMSPQTRLPGLREGQSWTMEVYSPLHPPSPENPLEILHARVERKESISWNGGTVPTWLVVYRSDSAAATHTDAKPVARLWVRADGTVLKQEVGLFRSEMTFVRLSSAQATALAAQVDYRP
jgi:hypothetical protein